MKADRRIGMPRGNPERFKLAISDRRRVRLLNRPSLQGSRVLDRFLHDKIRISIRSKLSSFTPFDIIGCGIRPSRPLPLSALRVRQPLAKILRNHIPSLGSINKTLLPMPSNFISSSNFGRLSRQCQIFAHFVWFSRHWLHYYW